MNPIKRVAVIGLGSVGASYALLLSQNMPDVTIYGVVRDIDLFWGNPIFVNNIPLKINYRTIDSLSTVPLDLILICVKSFHLDELLESMRELIRADTIIIPLMSGVENGKKIALKFGAKHLVEAALMNAVMSRNGRYVTLNSYGVIYYGINKYGIQNNIQAIKEFFSRGKICSEQTANITYFLWKGLMIATGFMQVCTVYQLTYGDFVKNDKAMELMRSVQREIVNVANSLGVGLSEQDVSQCARTLKKLPADSYPFMLHDYWANRRLETAALGDYVCDLARQTGVNVPANQWLRDQVNSMLSTRAELPIRHITNKHHVGLPTRAHIVTPEKIANQLRFDIITARYRQGDRLSENELARRFQVSRSSVRTGLSTIANEGMIKTLANGRRTVVGFSSMRVEEMYETRWLIESHAISNIIKKNETVYPEVAAILGKIERKYNSPTEYEDWSELDIQFHRAIVSTSQNIFLLSAWDSMAQILYLLSQFSTVVKNRAQLANEFFIKHKKLYEMLLTGEPAIFPELKRHIEEEKELSLTIIRSFA